MIRRLFWLALLAAVLWFAAFSANRLIVYPFDPTETAPRSVGLTEFTATTLKGPAGDVVVWQSPAKGRKPVVFYLHGNAGSLANRAGRFRRLTRNGFGVVAFGYPGSSGSRGQPNEALLIETARAIYDQTIHTQKHVIYGESLGAAVALGLVEDLQATPSLQRPEGAVLEAPFTSVQDVARASVGPLAMAAPYVLDQWPSQMRAEQTDLPVVILHGAQDAFVPLEQGETLFNALPSARKALLVAKDADHLNLWSSDEFLTLLRRMGHRNLGL